MLQGHRCLRDAWMIGTTHAVRENPTYYAENCVTNTLRYRFKVLDGSFESCGPLYIQPNAVIVRVCGKGFVALFQSTLVAMTHGTIEVAFVSAETLSELRGRLNPKWSKFNFCVESMFRFILMSCGCTTISTQFSMPNLLLCAV